MKSYNDRIATISVAIAVLAIIASLITPEIRDYLFGKKEEIATHPTKQESLEKDNGTNAEKTNLESISKANTNPPEEIKINKTKTEESVEPTNEKDISKQQITKSLPIVNSKSIPYVVQHEEVSGVRVSVTNCELIGKKIICSLLYENISTAPSKNIFICPKGEKMIDGNGLTYNCSLHSVGNVESRSGTYSCEIIQGTKVKARMEFMVGDTSFNELASLEVRTAATGERHNFYNVQVAK